MQQQPDECLGDRGGHDPSDTRHGPHLSASDRTPATPARVPGLIHWVAGSHCGGSATAARRTRASWRRLLALLGSARRRVWCVRPLGGGVEANVEPGHQPVAQVLGGKLTQWFLGHQRPCRGGDVVTLAVSVLHQRGKGRPVALVDQARVELGGQRRPALLRGS
jgi:hypothetical protein